MKKVKMRAATRLMYVGVPALAKKEIEDEGM